MVPKRSNIVKESITEVPEEDDQKKNIFILPLYTHRGKDNIRPMTKEESLLLVTLTMSELTNPGIHDIEDQMQALRAFPMFKILDDRLRRNGAEADMSLKAMVIDLSRSPGEIVMWAYTLHRMQEELRRRPTLEDFSTTYFPIGVPTELAYSRMWDSQKLNKFGIDRPSVGSDNFIDYQEAWLPVQPLQ